MGRLVESLLDQLCRELGFCLESDARALIVRDPPRSVDALAERVWRAEGMGDIPPKDPLFAQLTSMIAVFPDVGSMRVFLPGRRLVASVNVNSSCRPRESTHVFGTFEAGPAFALVAPDVDRMRALHAAGEIEAAFGLSAEMDELGATAEDDLGRVYGVFNMQFAPDGGLLFAIG